MIALYHSWLTTSEASETYHKHSVTVSLTGMPTPHYCASLSNCTKPRTKRTCCNSKEHTEHDVVVSQLAAYSDIDDLALYRVPVLRILVKQVSSLNARRQKITIQQLRVVRNE